MPGKQPDCTRTLLNFWRKAQKDQCNNEEQDEASITALTPKPASVNSDTTDKTGSTTRDQSPTVTLLLIKNYTYYNWVIEEVGG